jgi:3-methylcrotonyl-CoA carboxylase alpha subunit
LNGKRCSADRLDFLARLVALPSFANAELDTGLIERKHALLFTPADDVPGDVWRIAALAELLREQRAVERKAAAAADPH